MPSDPVFVREIEEFLYHEARLLDDRQFEDWMALFAKDGVYWIPAMPEQEDPLGEASIAYEDLQLIDVRVRRLRHPENYADQPHMRSRRIIGNVILESDDRDEPVVRSNFTMVDFQNDEQRIFAGEYVHSLRRSGKGYGIVQKRVNLLNCDAPMGAIVIPL